MTFRLSRYAFVLLASLTLSLAASAQTVGQDAKGASHDTADASKQVAHKTAHGTKKVYHKTVHGTKPGAKKVGHGTKVAAKDTAHGTQNLGDKIAGKPAVH